MTGRSSTIAEVTESSRPLMLSEDVGGGVNHRSDAWSVLHQAGGLPSVDGSYS
jgi:hypothetical protein